MGEVVVLPGSDRGRAAVLARQLGLRVADAGDDSPGGLVLIPGARLELARIGPGQLGPIAVDFLSQEAGRRARGAVRGAPPLLARALGIGRGVTSVVDATAGLGRDALTLALSGADVTMVERDPVLVALLADGLDRARAAAAAFTERLRLVHADARTYLADAPVAPDAVYLDPMFPDRRKAALPTKELQLLRALLGAGRDDADQLFEVARAVALRRVVVKRPPHARSLGGDARPDAVVGGTRVRYEIFRPQRLTGPR